MTKQRAFQKRRIAIGRCMICSELRPPDLASRCRLCQDKHNARRNRNAANKRRARIPGNGP